MQCAGFLLTIHVIELITAVSGTKCFSLLSDYSSGECWCDKAFTKTCVFPAAGFLGLLAIRSGAATAIILLHINIHLAKRGESPFLGRAWNKHPGFIQLGK